MPQHQIAITDNNKEPMFPIQCSCGHFYFERYKFNKPNEQGEIGFCWCGFCQTKLMIKPVSNSEGEA